MEFDDSNIHNPHLKAALICFHQKKNELQNQIEKSESEISSLRQTLQSLEIEYEELKLHASKPDVEEVIISKLNFLKTVDDEILAIKTKKLNNEVSKTNWHSKVGFLEEIALSFPQLKISALFEGEKLFYDADTNHDGVIDMKELEQILLKCGEFLTPTEIKNVLSEFDRDHSGTIDIMEYLCVLEKIQTQREVKNIPKKFLRGFCSIQ